MPAARALPGVVATANFDSYNLSMRIATTCLLVATSCALVVCGGGDAPIVQDVDFCAVDTDGTRVEVVRPANDEPPIDDVNWFARPVPTSDGRWLVAFASHDQNYLYDLGAGRRIRIPDRSDAVATPDGRYVTVPSYYTPDEYIRFYDAQTLIDHLDRDEDAADVPPVYIHEHEDLRKVYYQSTSVVSSSDEATIYRLMFSGTASEAGFRIVDYTFESADDGAIRVSASEPMKLCPEIDNDLNTPFISKDARYVVSYTSSSDAQEYTPGSSLKIYRIVETLPAEGSTSCEEVVDFGFAAGKADFSFDNSMLAFHISKGGYLTPFVNGGLESPTSTDIVVVQLETDEERNITGYSRMTRITTSTPEGVGNYFPAFLNDGNLFYIFNEAPKEQETNKRFSFKVVGPRADFYAANVFASAASRESAASIGRLWQDACAPDQEPLKEHEAPWLLMSLSEAQCNALVEASTAEGAVPDPSLVSACATRPS